MFVTARHCCSFLLGSSFEPLCTAPFVLRAHSTLRISFFCRMCRCQCAWRRTGSGCWKKRLSRSQPPLASSSSSSSSSVRLSHKDPTYLKWTQFPLIHVQTSQMHSNFIIDPSEQLSYGVLVKMLKSSNIPFRWLRVSCVCAARWSSKVL